MWVTHLLKIPVLSYETRVRTPAFALVGNFALTGILFYLLQAVLGKCHYQHCNKEIVEDGKGKEKKKTGDISGYI